MARPTVLPPRHRLFPRSHALRRMEALLERLGARLDVLDPRRPAAAPPDDVRPVLRVLRVPRADR